MTNRLEDAKASPCHNPETLPPLPVINWTSIGQEAPVNVDLGSPSEDAPLPKADIVVITWTSAEWSALDHVFANSNTERYRTSTTFRKEWHYRAKKEPVEGAYHLWGYYRMVKIKNAQGIGQNVLLYKSSVHLSHPPYCTGLKEMVQVIVDEASPTHLYSIGTAGGASLTENLGDTVVTNAGHILTKKSENDACKLNGVNVACKNWFPSFDLISSVENNLLFKLKDAVTEQELEYLFCQTMQKHPTQEGKVTLKDLVNAPLDPANLGSPKGLNKQNVPLLTTDYYYIAHGDDSTQYCALEMDDAVVGLYAGELGVDYVFVRNISDPIVPDKTLDGQPIDPELGQDWSGDIYTNFGIYTSMNGALITWATIAGSTASAKGGAQ